MSVEVPRTEDMPTFLLWSNLGRDPEPYIARHNRPIPSESYSREEFGRLMLLALESTTAPLLTPVPTPQQLARIDIRSTSGCWELPTYEDGKGRSRYGNLSVDGVGLNGTALAHRIMYLVFYGLDALPNGRQDFLDHLCENKACCYPRHLELVTPAINTGRARWAHVDGQIELEYLAAD